MKIGDGVSKSNIALFPCMTFLAQVSLPQVSRNSLVPQAKFPSSVFTEILNQGFHLPASAGQPGPGERLARQLFLPLHIEFSSNRYKTTTSVKVLGIVLKL